MFAAPEFPGDEQRTHRARLFNICYLSCNGWLLLVLAGNIMGGRIPTPMNFVLGGAMIVGLAPYLWARLVRLETGAAMWLAYAFTMATVGMATLGTIRAPSLGFFLILVVSSGLVFGRRMMLAMIVLSSMAVAGLIWAENQHWLPIPDYRVGVTQWVTAAGFFAWMGGVTMAATRQIRHALARAEREVEERRRAEHELRESNRQLEEALGRVKTLSGLLPMCAWCHKVREDEGYWSQLESYLAARTDATITHSICPQCREKHFPVCTKV